MQWLVPEKLNKFAKNARKIALQHFSLAYIAR